MSEEKTGTAAMQKAMSTFDRLDAFSREHEAFRRMVLHRLTRIENLIIQHHGGAVPLTMSPDTEEDHA